MKFAICEWVTPIKGPAIFPRLKSLGIDGIQLDDWDAAAQNHPLTQSYVQRLYKDAAAQTGISLIGVAGNALGRDGGMILPMDTEQGRRCWDDLTRGLDACAQMKLPIYLAPAFFAGFPRTQAERRRIAQRMKEACHYCLGSQVTVTLESIFSATELRRLIDWIDFPNFGIYYDTQNPVTYAGIHVPDDIRAIGPGKIAQIHVKDGVGSIQGSVNLGMGETDFFATAEAIREIGYDGWIVLENYYSRPCFSSELADPWDRIARDAEIARKAFHITSSSEEEQYALRKQWKSDRDAAG